MFKPEINGKIKLEEFVEPELDYFRQYCNFSEAELDYFNYKAKNLSNIQIAMKMNISESTVSGLARKVKKKIIKLI